MITYDIESSLMKINIPNDKLVDYTGLHEFSVSIADSEGAESTSKFLTEFILVDSSL
jgi:hypothetical protein